jgi:hypothetical protein
MVNVAVRAAGPFQVLIEPLSHPPMPSLAST